VENLSKNPSSQQFALQICSILHPKQLAKTLSSIGQICGISATTAIEGFEKILYAERKVLKIGHDLPLRRYWANEKKLVFKYPRLVDEEGTQETRKDAILDFGGGNF
jgi:hypothetical protein